MDPEMKKLLEEIRDLHKEHLERYKEFTQRALHLQEVSMRRFQGAATVQRIALVLVFFAVIGTVCWLVYLAWSYSPVR
jgi:cell division septal protein FtsQ